MRNLVIACTVGICLMALPAFAGLAAGIAAFEKEDYATAFKEFKPLAEKGDAVAQQKLGSMYRDGIGVPQDDKESLKWYRLAAAKGNMFAYYNLGAVYAEGKTVQQDFKEAARWFRLAADQGHDYSQFYLGRMYMDGDGVTKDDKEAVKWFRLAADQGNSEAQYTLGLMYANGFSVPKRAIVAYALNLVAVSSREDKTPGELAKVADDMSAEDREEAQALSLEMTKTGNLLKALDQYTKHQADAQLVLVNKKSARYKISADGQEVTDTETELVWRRCAEGMTVVRNSCQGKPGTYTHDAAEKLAAGEAARTGKDWHLPRINEELMTIRDYELKPAIHPVAFPDTPPGSFWSSSANRLTPGAPSSWVLGFYEESFGADSGITENTYENFVRLVRTSN